MQTSTSPKSPAPLKPLAPAIRIILAILFVIVGFFFAIGFIITSLALIGLFFVYLNLFAVSFPVALFSFTAHIASAIVCLIITILSFIFAYRLLRKRPIPQELIVTFIVILAGYIAIYRLFPALFQFISNLLGL